MENLVVGGVLLLLFGYSSKNIYAIVAGVLLATIKMQEVTLLLLVLTYYILLTWSPRDWLRAGLPMSGILALSLLWRGRTWFTSLFGANYQKYTNSIIDMSASAALTRLGFLPPYIISAILVTVLGITLTIAWKSGPAMSREKAGMLLAGSLLIAPYAAGNSVLSVVAIGVIPLFKSNQLLGGILLAIINFPYIWSTEMLFYFQAYYWTLVVFLIWFILAWRCHAVTPPDATPESTLSLDRT
jgi:hypothetical protein